MTQTITVSGGGSIENQTGPEGPACGDGKLEGDEWCDGELGITDAARLECVDCTGARITDCGVDLTKEGQYTLASEIRQIGMGNCITISTDNVSVN